MEEIGIDHNNNYYHLIMYTHWRRSIALWSVEEDVASSAEVVVVEILAVGEPLTLESTFQSGVQGQRIRRCIESTYLGSRRYFCHLELTHFYYQGVRNVPHSRSKPECNAKRKANHVH